MIFEDIAQTLDGESISRRKFLAGAGATGAAALAGCQTDSEENNTTKSTTSTTTTTEKTTTEETTTEETTTKEEPLPEQGSINAVPANPDAEYADSEIFNILDGDIKYELDLEKARERHHDNLEDKAIDHPLLQKFAENIDDEEWLKTNIIERYNNSGPENRAEGEYTFDWSEYKKDAPLDQRIEDSNFMDLWYPVEIMSLGDISSTHKHYKAAVIQQIEEKAGKDTIVWGHHTGNDRHGLVSAITNPTYNESGFSEQETFVIETDDDEEPQASNLAEEGYITNDDGEHPAIQRKDIDSFWTFMLGGEMSEDEKLYAKGVYSTDKGQNAFADFIMNPSTDSGQKYFDLMMVGGDMAVNPEFEDKEIRVDQDRIVYG